MANQELTDQKLTDLTAATTPLAGTEQVYVVQGGADRRTTAQAIAQTAAASYATAAQGAKADTAIQPGNAALGDAREWSADTISQVEAEAGTAATRRAFTAQRVFQAIAAWWAASSAKTKLDGVATGATENQTDAYLLSRANHTGTQAAGTITGLAAVATSGAYSDLSGRPALGTAAVTDVSAYATAAQGAKADAAIQPGNPALSDARTPTPHAASHATGGSDAITPAAIGAATAAQGARADTAVQPAALSGYVQTTDSRLATDLSYDAASREVRSSTGADVALPLVSASAAGLAPAFTSATGKVLTDGGWATPSAGSPGGSSGQLQWNNGGAFAGLSTSSIDGSGNMTFSGRWIQSVNGAASAPPLALTGTWFTGGTATTTKPHFLIEPAGTTSTNWATGGTGLGVNAPSGFAGNLLDLQVGGSRRISFYSQTYVGQECGEIALHGPSNTRLRLGCVDSNALGINLSDAGEYYRFSTSTGFFVAGSCCIGWANGGLTSTGINDLTLFRDTNDTLAQRRTTNPQTFRLYNTFTSATSFERLNVRWTSNEAIIDTEAGSGGGTLRGLKIGSAGTSRLGFYGATPAVQPAAVADATDASTVITQLNALLSRLRTIGLIAT